MGCAAFLLPIFIICFIFLWWYRLWLCYVHYSILVAFFQCLIILFLSGIRHRSVAGKKSKPKKDQKVDQKKTTFCEKEDKKATIFLKNPLQKSQD